jgi:hypothetical protein
MAEPENDPYDLWWKWATRDRATDYRTIPAEIHDAVMALPAGRAP